MKQPWIGISLLLIAAMIITVRGIIKKHKSEISFLDLLKELFPKPILLLIAMIITAIIVMSILKRNI
ncbi:MAG TPA: hypothetical protein DG577_08345 [Firmicutes bacterium]|jgi:hypothetical protein|nr:hypothetical protein [Bacillota bacterium]HCX79410.1 hypothetical protein [Bacillota bacterium]